MRSLALIGPGPTWTDGRPVFDQDPLVLRDHLDYMGRLFGEGALLLGGPVRGGRSGIALLEAASLDEAEASIAADPAVRAGLFRFDITALVPYFDVLARSGSAR